MLDLFGEGFPSGQRDQTVNLTRKLRWFESTPLHHKDVSGHLGCYRRIVVIAGCVAGIV